jgi:CRP-like cAMP-binding protein
VKQQAISDTARSRWHAAGSKVPLALKLAKSAGFKKEEHARTPAKAVSTPAVSLAEMPPFRMGEGSVFGEAGLASEFGAVRTSTVQAVCQCALWVLGQADYQQAMSVAAAGETFGAPTFSGFRKKSDQPRKRPSRRRSTGHTSFV